MRRCSYALSLRRSVESWASRKKLWRALLLSLRCRTTHQTAQRLLISLRFCGEACLRLWTGTAAGGRGEICRFVCAAEVHESGLQPLCRQGMAEMDEQQLALEVGSHSLEADGGM